MIEIFLLPELRTVRLHEMSRRTDSKSLHEIQEIGLSGKTFDEQIQMIRHEAIRMYSGAAGCRCFAKNFHQGNTAFSLCEIRLTSGTAQGDEYRCLTDIVLRLKTDVSM